MAIPLRVLFVEDSEDDVLLVSRELRRGGYNPIMDRVEKPEAMKAALTNGCWDVIIADYTIPHFGASAALTMYKECGFDLPFIVVSGTADEETMVELMKAGAHDYISKGKLTRLVPAVQRELRDARVRQERRRAESALVDSHQQLQDMLEGVVYALSSTTEKRDPYTAGHQRRVSDLACAIAQELGTSESEIEGLRMAGLLHDIGKICVPTEILSRSGEISALEFNIIRAHPQAGYEILQEICFPWPVKQTILQHHERLNGSGYPAGLSGAQILPQAYVLAVADVIEAMSSHRPYRPARPLDEALQELDKNKGVLYDRPVVAACISLYQEKDFIQNQYEDLDLWTPPSLS